MKPVCKMIAPDHPSHIHSAGFPDEARGPLRVQFKNKDGDGLGDLGEYVDVPRSAFEALLRDPSPGTFVHQQLKPFFTYRKLNLQFRVMLVIGEVEYPSPDALEPYDLDNANAWPLGDYPTVDEAIRRRNAMVVVDDPTPEEMARAFPDELIGNDAE